MTNIYTLRNSERIIITNEELQWHFKIFKEDAEHEYPGSVVRLGFKGIRINKEGEISVFADILVEGKNRKVTKFMKETNCF